MNHEINSQSKKLYVFLNYACGAPKTFPFNLTWMRPKLCKFCESLRDFRHDGAFQIIKSLQEYDG